METKGWMGAIAGIAGLLAAVPPLVSMLRGAPPTPAAGTTTVTVTQSGNGTIDQVAGTIDNSDHSVHVQNNTVNYVQQYTELWASGVNRIFGGDVRREPVQRSEPTQSPALPAHSIPPRPTSAPTPLPPKTTPPVAPTNAAQQVDIQPQQPLYIRYDSPCLFACASEYCSIQTATGEIDNVVGIRSSGQCAGVYVASGAIEGLNENLSPFYAQVIGTRLVERGTSARSKPIDSLLSKSTCRGVLPCGRVLEQSALPFIDGTKLSNHVDVPEVGRVYIRRTIERTGKSDDFMFGGGDTKYEWIVVGRREGAAKVTSGDFRVISDNTLGRELLKQRKLFQSEQMVRLKTLLLLGMKWEAEKMIDR